MTHFRFSHAAAVAAALAFAGLIALAPAHATTSSGGSGISGFSDPQGFTLNDSNGTTPAPSINGSTLEITADQVEGQGNSAICNVPQNIGAFSVTFTYQATYNSQKDSSLSPADGATFVIENDPRGVNAVGDSGSDLGYADEQGAGISPVTNSLAIAFNIYDGHTSGTNLLTGGNDPGFVYNSTSPVALQKGDPMNVRLTYDGTTLTETITDAKNNNTYTASYPIDIASTVGGSTAYIGFTGSTGGGTATQTFSNFSFNSFGSLDIQPNTVLGGKNASGTIYLLNPVSSSTLVRLSSSDPTNATVKNTIYISAGHSSVTFNISTQGVSNPDVVTITAAVSGGPTLQSTLTVNPPGLTASGIELNGNPVVGGNYVFASANISSPASAGGVTVQLGLKSDPGGAVQGFWSAPPGTDGAMPITSVTIPAGATSAEFVVNTNEVTQNYNVVIQGTLAGVTRGATLTVIPPQD